MTAKLATVDVESPYDTWTEGQIAVELIRLREQRDKLNRLIDDMVDRRIEMLCQQHDTNVH
ncbi:MAG: hypothetical protein GY947_02900 [Rhodobacteraceae bacterium]|nr:hypothetical protein [Paracoccaceae bacterium]